MFKIDAGKIYLTQGDTAEFKPIIEGYEAEEGDTVQFRVVKVWSQDPVITKTIAAGANVEFAAEDTIDLPTGSYLYNIKVIGSNGNVSTFSSDRFVLLGGTKDGEGSGE